MSQYPEQDEPRPARSLTLLDAAGLVVGYSLASMLVSAYWPRTRPSGLWVFALLAGVFAWLGLAMSGPVLLLMRRPPRGLDPSGAAGERTWVESAWLVVGLYWIGLMMVVVPARMAGGTILDMAALGVFPVLAVLILRSLLEPGNEARARMEPASARWTHRAGQALLASWPLAWAAIIVLGRVLP